MEVAKREQWKSRLGFILATSGASIGLGNIQRFPYLTAKFGGGVFLFVYLICVLFLGIPLILNEFAIGRHGKRNPFAAIRSIHSQGWWKYVGLLGVLVAFFILSYYAVVAGWTLGYVVNLAQGNLPDIKSFSANATYVIPAMACVLLGAVVVVRSGLQKGIERWSKILMPLLLVLLVLLVIRSLTLPNAWAGLSFYLAPDFSQLTPKVLLYALGQAFFSLCVGEAVLMTYGSYASKTENLVGSAFSVAFFDTIVAVLAGFLIFPALFSAGKEFEAGTSLVFEVIPTIFIDLPFGHYIGAAFFLMLFFAAFTTCIALLEMPVTFLIESSSISRKKATLWVSLLAFLVGIPAALSKGASLFLSELRLPFVDEVGIYDIMDFIWGSLGMVVGGLFLAIFTGWIWGTRHAVEELSQGAVGFHRIAKAWTVIIKYIAPITIIGILASVVFHIV